MSPGSSSPARSLSNIAREICEKYSMHLVRHVGTGAFKETYHVISKDKSNIALKIFTDAQSHERSKREINALLKCNHNNIAKLLDISAYKNHLFLIEEFLDGGTLSEVRKKDTLSASRIKTIALQIASALSHLKDKNLVHRDIKPDNIMFRHGKTTAVLVDFGLVRDLSCSSLTLSCFLPGPGTPIYASPEQLNNDKHIIDWRTDQFCFGIVFFELLFGHHPYSEKNNDLQEIISNVASRVSLPDWVIKKSKQFNTGHLLNMISSWPIQRFRTPQKLLDALKTWEAS